MKEFEFHDVDVLLDRLGNGYEKGKEFVFLIGSGVTCPVGDTKGVLGVNGVVDLIRKEFSRPISKQVIKHLDAHRARSSTDEYQAAFAQLDARRGQNFVNLVIRQAVLAARIEDDPLAEEIDRLRTEEIRSDECRNLCELLEKDVQHWHLRPGIRSLGKILTEFRNSFGTTVLTTNFDPLIKVSTRLAGGPTETWMLHGDGPLIWPSSDSVACRIIHLHGSWAGDTLHRNVVLERERPNLEIGLAKILLRRALIVIGYGGWDDVFTKAITSINRDPEAQHDVLWTFFESDQQRIENSYGPLLQRLKSDFGGNRVVFLKGIDADSFFPALLDRLRDIRKSNNRPTQAAQIHVDLPQSIQVTDVQPQPAAQTNAQIPPQAGTTSHSYVDFLSILRKRCDSLTQVDVIPEKERASIQTPNFLLFEREGNVVMTIAPGSAHIHPHKLQKTTEPQTKSEPLPLERVEALGFTGGKVHPMFRDEARVIQRIYWDAELLVQTILFPDSKIALPLYEADGTERTLLAPIHTALEILIEWHGQDRFIFANIVDRDRERTENPVFEKLIADQPIVTRFAPTPSSQLHLGNVRTALATYLMSLRDQDRSRFFIRIDNTDNTRTHSQFIEKIKNELNWLGLRWDETKDTFEQDTAEASERYESLLRVLKLAEFTELGKGNTVILKSLPVEQYYCVYYDRREGAVISHEPPLTKRGSLFSRADLKNSASLLRKLRDPKSLLSKYLWEQFTANAKRRLAGWTKSSPLPASLQEILIEELNTLLVSPYLFQKKRFAHLRLKNKTLRLIEDNPRDDDIELLNRMLLEEAYPHELGKRPRRSKTIGLSRGNNLNVFYRFAGLIDDIRSLNDKDHLTCVLRDNRQAELTQVQAHIRYALELARQKLLSNTEAQKLFRDAGLNPQKSIPLPIYFHLPVVTDNGEVKPLIANEKGKLVPQYTVLRKRKADEEVLDNYTLQHLRNHDQMLPESIVAYLVSTIIPRQTTNHTWKEHLAAVAFIFSQLGVHAGLQFFSQRFSLDDLVRRQKPIRCNLRHLRFTEQIIIGKLSVWRLQDKLKNLSEFKQDLPNPDLDRLIGRIGENSAEFANFSQIISMVKKLPDRKTPLSPETIRLLQTVGIECQSDGELLGRINQEIDGRRRQLPALTNGERELHKSALFQLLADLRLALLDAGSSPKIGPVMKILGEQESATRIRRYVVERNR